MSSLRVLFDIPPDIQQGLAIGTLERIGGVIRTVERKEIVAWLRDSAEIAHPDQLPSFISTTLFSGIATGQLLTLSLTTASLATIAQRLDKLSLAIGDLADLIREEFNRERDNDFQNALWLAQQQIDNPAIRRDQRLTAITKLRAAYQNFLQDFEHALEYDLNVAQHYLIRAMYAANSYVRCYIDLYEMNSARINLREVLETLLICTLNLVDRWLGLHPAVFLHKTFDRAVIERFFSIKRWLTQSDQAADDHLLLDMLDDLRVDFWNEEALQPLKSNLGERLQDTLQIVRRQQNYGTLDKPAQLLHRLAQAEVVIENYRRLQGYDLELRALRLSDMSFETWSDHLQNEGIGILIPDEPITLDAHL